jgi:RNA polymerase sigma factor (sigma-70 family)
VCSAANSWTDDDRSDSFPWEFFNMQEFSVQWQARFHTVVPPHLAEARALARSLTRSGADSEDVVQEACLRAFRGIAGFEGNNARAWILTIVRHTAYDWMRKNRFTAVPIEDFAEFVDRGGFEEMTSAGAAELSPEMQLASDQQAQQLQQAIESLPAAFRQTFLLRYGEELSYKEIASATGVPPGTVMSRLNRARRQLVRVMQAQ